MVRVLPLLVVLALFGCSKSTPAAANAEDAAASPVPAAQEAAANGGQPAEPPAKPVPAQLPEVVARVNGETITKAELEAAVQNIEANAGGPVPADQRDRIYRGLLDQMIGYKLLVQETRARKVSVSDADVDARIAEMRQQFPNEAAFTEALARENVTLEKLRSDARADMMVSSMLSTELGSKIVVTPEQINDFYQKNPTQFLQPERVRASHILIGFPENADAAAKSATRTKAEGVLKEVQAGKDFAALARQHSTDTGSGAQGGDLGYFSQGQMVPPFDQAAFSMKPGQTSELVETQFGFHIIRVADHQAAGTVPLDGVRDDVKQFLEQQTRQQVTASFVETLKAKGKIEIFM